MKKLLLSLALLVSACHSSTATDGYYFEKQTQLLAPREIKVVLWPTLAALTHQYAVTHNSTSLPDGRILMAYSVIGPKVCTINMIDPKIQYMPEFFGHELTHCLYGEFHPSQNG